MKIIILEGNHFTSKEQIDVTLYVLDYGINVLGIDLREFKIKWRNYGWHRAVFVMMGFPKYTDLPQEIEKLEQAIRKRFPRHIKPVEAVRLT